MNFQTRYRPYVRHGIVCRKDGKGRVKQSSAQSCDINLIVARFMKTGVLDHVRQNQPLYADLTQMPKDLLEAREMVERASAAFMELPWQLRKRFGNDPAVLSAAQADDPQALQKAIKEVADLQRAAAVQAATGGTEPPVPTKREPFTPPAIPKENAPVKTEPTP